MGMVLFGVVISVLSFGTLSAKGAMNSELPIYQYSKSLTLFGVAERFEAVTSVALTLGLFCTLSLLLTAAEQMVKHGAAIGAVVASINVQINTVLVMIIVVLMWIILPLINRKKIFEKR